MKISPVFGFLSDSDEIGAPPSIASLHNLSPSFDAYTKSQRPMIHLFVTPGQGLLFGR